MKIVKSLSALTAAAMVLSLGAVSAMADDSAAATTEPTTTGGLISPNPAADSESGAEATADTGIKAGVAVCVVNASVVNADVNSIYASALSLQKGTDWGIQPKVVLTVKKNAASAETEGQTPEKRDFDSYTWEEETETIEILIPLEKWALTSAPEYVKKEGVTAATSKHITDAGTYTYTADFDQTIAERFLDSDEYENVFISEDIPSTLTYTVKVTEKNPAELNVLNGVNNNIFNDFSTDGPEYVIDNGSTTTFVADAAHVTSQIRSVADDVKMVVVREDGADKVIFSGAMKDGQYPTEAEVTEAIKVLAAVNTDKASDTAVAAMKEFMGESKGSYEVVSFQDHVDDFGFNVQVKVKTDLRGSVGLCWYNNKTGKIEVVNSKVTVDPAGYATFTTDHCSDFFLTSSTIILAAGEGTSDSTEDVSAPESSSETESVESSEASSVEESSSEATPEVPVTNPSTGNAPVALLAIPVAIAAAAIVINKRK